MPEPVTFTNNTSSCYSTKVSPLPGFDSNCKQCSLNTGCSVGPAGPDTWSRIKLIVISEYPGHYEEEHKFPQVPNSYANKKRTRLPSFPNGGELMRSSIETLFGISHTNEVYYTNGVKCNPNFKGRDFKVSRTKHTNICAQWWLTGEFYLLDKYAPNAPVIICGNIALQAIASIYPEVIQQVPSWDLKHTRRRKDIVLGQHKRPVAVTFNPAMPAKSFMRLENTIGVSPKSGIIEVKSVRYWEPVLVGSPIWNFYKDISWLKDCCRVL